MMFQLNRRKLMLTPEEVERAARLASPVDPAQARAGLCVQIGPRFYPVKDALWRSLTGVDRMDFTTQQAASILRQLGFTVVRFPLAPDAAEPEEGQQLAGQSREGGPR